MGEVSYLNPPERVIEEMNFLDLYLRGVGATEVPEQFHTWTALSLIAACLEHRVWFERMSYQKIYPNLYVFLIGGSASGKGTAIGLGKRVLDDMARSGYDINYHRGSSTRAAMQDALAERWKDSWKQFEERLKAGDLYAEEPKGVSLFTMAPELSSNISVGPMAKDMIKFLTDLWEGDVGKYQERTRGMGKHEFENPCLNLLAGSAPEWCREVVDAKDLSSGFWARVVCVTGEIDYNIRIARPDTRLWAETLPWLSWRLSLLMKKIDKDDIPFEGQMVLSPEAEQLDIEWYNTRPEPEDALYQAHWRRQPDQVLRIAMLLRFCDYWEQETMPGDGWKVIHARHWRAARALSEQLMRNATTFLGNSLGHTYNQKTMIVEELIRKHGSLVQKPQLIRMVSKHGIKAKDLEMAIQGLEDEEKVVRELTRDGQYRVRWRG